MMFRIYQINNQQAMQNILCKYSKLKSNRFCIYDKCEEYPFVCNNCYEEQCTQKHNHFGRYYFADTKQFVQTIIPSKIILKKYFIAYTKNVQKQIKIIKQEMEGLFKIYQQELIESIKTQNPYYDLQSFEKVTGKELKYFDKAKALDYGQLEKKLQGHLEPILLLVQEINNQIEKYKLKQNVIEKRQFKNELNNLNEKIKENPNDTSLVFQRAILKQRFFKNDEAIQDYSLIIELEPKNSEGYNSRGVLYKEVSRYQQALADFNKAIQLQKENHQYYNNRSLVYKKLNKYSQALKDLNDAIKLNQYFDKAYYNRGLLYYINKDYTAAIQDYTKSLELNPNFFEAYNNRGSAYNKLGNLVKAEADFTTAIILNPNKGIYYLNRSNIYKRLNKPDKEEQDLVKYKQLSEKFKQI